MKKILVIGYVLSAVALVACGGSATSDPGTTVLTGKEGRPDVPVPVGPPPTKLVVKELKEGSGRAARRGDEMTVRYFLLEYTTHRVLEDHWHEPSTFILGDGEMSPAWEAGLPGMKPGGRRELSLPEGGAFIPTPQLYVIDAISVEAPKG